MIAIMDTGTIARVETAAGIIPEAAGNYGDVTVCVIYSAAQTNLSKG